MEVGGSISGLEDGYDAGVAGGVWMADIHNLQIHLETSTPLVPPQLHPHLTGWDGAIVPSGTARSSVSQERTVIC